VEFLAVPPVQTGSFIFAQPKYFNDDQPPLWPGYRANNQPGLNAGEWYYLCFLYTLKEPLLYLDGRLPDGIAPGDLYNAREKYLAFNDNAENKSLEEEYLSKTQVYKDYEEKLKEYRSKIVNEYSSWLSINFTTNPQGGYEIIDETNVTVTAPQDMVTFVDAWDNTKTDLQTNARYDIVSSFNNRAAGAYYPAFNEKANPLIFIIETDNNSSSDFTGDGSGISMQEPVCPRLYTYKANPRVYYHITIIPPIPDNGVAKQSPMLDDVTLTIIGNPSFYEFHFE
jgi:hypothetical protein